MYSKTHGTHGVPACRFVAHIVMLSYGLTATPVWAQSSTDKTSSAQTSLSPQKEKKTELDSQSQSFVIVNGTRQPADDYLAHIATDENLEVIGSAHNYTTPAATLWGKTPVALKDIPQSVSVVTQQRMEDQNMQSMTDVLKQVTGVTIQPNDTTNSQYYARGYSLNVTTDGTPSYGALGNGGATFDTAIYDRVEMLRGSAGMLQGSGDLGGTVNMVTKKPKDNFAISGAATAASWNNYRGDIDISVPLNQARTLRFRTVDSFQNKNFFYSASEDRKWLAYGALEYDLRSGTTFLVSHAAQHESVTANYSGLPTYMDGSLMYSHRSVNPTPPWTTNNWMTQQTLASVTQKLWRNWELTAKASIRDQNQHNRDVFALSALNPENNTLSYSWNRNIGTTQKWRSADVYLRGTETVFGLEQNFLFGFNYDTVDMVERYGNRGKSNPGYSFYNPGAVPQVKVPYANGDETLTVQDGFYGQLRLQPLKKFFVILGGRVSSFNSKTRDRWPSSPTTWEAGAKAHAKLTPYLGAVYQITPNLSAYASYASIFVPQTEFTESGKVLPAETGNQIEVGLKGEYYNGRLNVYVAGFRIEDDHRALYDQAFPNDDFYTSAGKIKTQGWETEVSGQILPGWDMTAGYTFVEMAYNNPDDYNFGSGVTPKHSFKLWTHYRVMDGRLKGLSAGIGLNAMSKFSGQSFVINGTDMGPNWQHAYVTLDASVGYRLGAHYTFQLNATNLTNAFYYERVGHQNTYNIPGSPRSFMGTVRVSY